MKAVRPSTELIAQTPGIEELSMPPKVTQHGRLRLSSNLSLPLAIGAIAIFWLWFLPPAKATTKEREPRVRNGNSTSNPCSNELTPLSVGMSIPCEIRGGYTHSYIVDMQANEYARIKVQRKGIDLLINVSSPGASNAMQYENPAGPHSPISLTIVASTAAKYTIAIQPIEKWVGAGRYEILLEDVRSVTPADQRRFEAERKVAEGRSKEHVPNDDSRRAALTIYRDALLSWRELNDPVEEANTLHFMARTYRALSPPEMTNCVETYKKVLELRGEDQQAKAYTVLDLAEAYSRLQNETALVHYKEAFELFKAIDNRSGQAAALYGMGLAKVRLARRTEALKDYEQALLIYTDPATRDRHEEARTLHAMGGAYDELTIPDEAQQFFERALEGWRETGDPGQEGNTYSSLAKLEMDRGNWQTAFDNYDKALELYKLAEQVSPREQIALRRRRASSLYNIAYTYAALGDYPKAFEMLDQSLALRQVGARGSTYMLTCYFQALSGTPEQALETCAKAIVEQEAAGDPRIGETHTAMGVAYAMMGKHQEALESYEKALAIQTNEKTRSPEAEAITQGWRGESFIAVGQLEKALESYSRARYLWQNKEPNGVAVALIGMARAERARNKLSLALDYVSEAIATIEPLRTNVTSEELRTLYFATKIDYYELYTDLNMQLAETSDNPKLTAAAFEASERARARSLTETLARARFEGGLKSNRELAALVSKYRVLYRQIKSAKPKKQEKTEAELKTKHAQIESELRTKYPRYAELMFPQPLKVTEVQKLLDADTLLLQFALGQERSYLWAVTATELRGYKLPPRTEIERTARELAKYLGAGQRRPGETATQLNTRLTTEATKYWPQATAFSRLLLGQVSALSQKKRLLIVADGELQYLPFAALPAPGTVLNSVNSGLRSVLVKDHEITNLPSASLLSILRQTVNRQQPSKLLAVFADPVVEKDDPRLQLSRRGKVVKPPTNGKALAQALRDVGDGNNTALGRLQASGRESRQIIGLAGRGSSLEHTGFEANRQNVTSKELSDYRYVHFATHGILDEIKPELSGVVLSLYDKQGRFHPEGYLRLNDIYGLNLPVDLVVLSACRSGLGKPIRGEGLIGLTRGFMYAGSQRVLASLWKVDDDATAELMKRFYQKMLIDGMAPAAALSAAQWSMSMDARWSNPYYWAGFILQGDPR